MILYISFFYTRSHWEQLAKKLTPALTHLERKKLVKTFNIIFGNERGDNISLVIYTVGEHEKKETQRYLSAHLGIFLKHYPSPDMPKSNVAATLFMNFPNNSIQYNLYKNDIIPENKQSDPTVEFFGDLAKLFLTLLSKNIFKQWITEPVIGLFIMQILLMKTFQFKLEESEKIFKKLYLTVKEELLYYDTLYLDQNKKPASISEKEMEYEFRNNEILLFDILNQLHVTEYKQLVLDDFFYHNYYKFCNIFYEKHFSTKDTSSKHISVQKKTWVIKTIRSQIGLLGLPPANELLVFYFLKNSYHQLKLEMQY